MNRALRLISIAADGLVPGRSYALKLATCTAHAVIGSSLHYLDLDTRESKPVDRLRQNDIGSATLDLDRPIACDRYAANKDTGSFILIDPVSHDTVGMGTVEAIVPEEEARLREPVQPRGRVVQFIRSTESHVRSVAKAISWRGTASLDTFVVALLITGSSKVAGGVALAEIFTKIALYYLHERIWVLVPWGRRA